MKTTVTAIFALGCIIIVIFAGCTKQLEPAELLQTYGETYNKHDIPAVLALMNDDVVFTLEGQATLSGKDEVRNMARADSVLNTQLTFENVTVDGLTILFSQNERSDWLDLVGVDALTYDPCTMVIEDGLISSVRVKENTNRSIVGPAVQRFVMWAVNKRPEDFDRLNQLGMGIENAELSLDLAREYRDILNSAPDSLR